MDSTSQIEIYNLSLSITGADVDTLVRSASEQQVYGICVPPFWINKASREISEKAFNLSTVIGYPTGYQMTETKIEEGRLAIRDGANELYLTLNYSAFIDGSNWPKIEVAKFSKLCHDSQKLLTVSLGSNILSQENIKTAALLSADAGADFVNISNGDSEEISIEFIANLRSFLPDRIGIKATLDEAGEKSVQEFIDAGVDLVRLSSLRN